MTGGQMKSLWLIFFCICFFTFSFPTDSMAFDQAIIRSIDDIELDRNYVEVSEEGLPLDHYNLLIQMMNNFHFTLMPEETINIFFESLKKDSQARMRLPGGKCSNRRAYIQNRLKKMNIVSGKIYIQCPGNRGQLRLKDQVTGHYYNFSNFHDTNIIAVQTDSTPEFRVLDVQFEHTPVSLQDYLTEIEAAQKIRPLKRGNSTKAGVCYWSISTPYLTL
jgi:hypothetical protein